MGGRPLGLAFLISVVAGGDPALWRCRGGPSLTLGLRWPLSTALPPRWTNAWGLWELLSRRSTRPPQGKQLPQSPGDAAVHRKAQGGGPASSQRAQKKGQQLGDGQGQANRRDGQQRCG